MRHIAFIYDPDRYWIGKHHIALALTVASWLADHLALTAFATGSAELVPNKF